MIAIPTCLYLIKLIGTIKLFCLDNIGQAIKTFECNNTMSFSNLATIIYVLEY